MQRDEDIQTLVSRIEALHAGLREEDVLLDERIARTEEALSLYERFRDRFSARGFSMRTVRRSSEGFSFSEFDWKALDA